MVLQLLRSSIKFKLSVANHISKSIPSSQSRKIGSKVMSIIPLEFPITIVVRVPPSSLEAARVKSKLFALYSPYTLLASVSHMWD